MYRYKEEAENKIKKVFSVLIIIVLTSVSTILVYNQYLGIELYSSDINTNNTKFERISATSEEVKKEDKKVTDIIEETNKCIVGISKLKSNGTIIFSNNTNELGLGTGIVISENGYILTNWHVAGDKYSNCYVTVESGNTYNGNVVWADSDLDLAILKITAKGLKYINLGDSDNIKVGETTYAIGNPVGIEFQKTVTSGIISGINRTIRIVENEKQSYMEDLIQTDATINPGNSGGPLINTDGECIGITTVKITDVDGIGFAVPINTVKPIIEKLLKEGKFEEAYLGIFGFDKEVIPYLESGLKLENGIYVAQIDTTGPCGKLSLKEGDIITQIDSISINKMRELKNYVYQKKPGEEVILKVARSGIDTNIKVTLGRK